MPRSLVSVLPSLADHIDHAIRANYSITWPCANKVPAIRHCCMVERRLPQNHRSNRAHGGQSSNHRGQAIHSAGQLVARSETHLANPREYLQGFDDRPILPILHGRMDVIEPIPHQKCFDIHQSVDRMCWRLTCRTPNWVDPGIALRHRRPSIAPAPLKSPNSCRQPERALATWT